MIHQKRAVRIARPRVQSTAAQARSTTFAVRLAAGEGGERGVEMPRLGHRRGQQQPGGHEPPAQLDHDSRPTGIHQAAKGGAQNGGDEKAEGECTGRYAPLPAELVEDRREEQREGGARVDPHAHRDEGDGHDDPAVEEGQCQRIRFAGGSPRAARRIFSAKVPAKATRSMAAFSAWSGGESITSEVIGGRTASAYIGGREGGASSTWPWRPRSRPVT